jgi:hypothetical protein
MQFKHFCGATALAVAVTIAASGTAMAQGTVWSPFVSVTPVAQGDGDLDGGGQVSATSLILRAGLLGDLGRGQRAGVVFNLDQTDYDFAAPAAFGGVAPWGTVQRYGVAAPLSLARSDGWVLGLTPTVDWIREKGADAGESLTWGAIVSATRFQSDGNRIGFGLGLFDRLEQTSVFPLLIVDWALSERWRLVNPLPAGPTGPAGLELDYRFDGGWNVGLGAAWRSTRFRLSDSGPVARGIGEERGVPVFLRATRNLGAGVTLYVYGGAVTAGELRVEDAAGHLLRQVDVGTAPLFGATLSARF